MAGHLLTLDSGCQELLHSESIDPRVLAGLQDAIDLVRGALAAADDTRRTHGVTYKHLSNAIDAMAAMIEPPPADAIDWAVRLVRLRERAQTAADISQTLMQEQGLSLDSDLHTWADAARSCIESHMRDAEIVLPLLRLDGKDVIALAERPPVQSPEWPVIEPLFRTIPNLADASERFEQTLRELGTVREQLAADRGRNLRPLARVDRIMQALQTSATDAASMNRRLVDVSHTSQSASST